MALQERSLNRYSRFRGSPCSSGGGAQLGLNQLLEMAEEAIGLKNFPETGALFSQALQENPESDVAMAGLIRCLTGTGEYAAARSMVEAMTDEMQASDAVKKAIQALDVAEYAAESAGQVGEFEAALAANLKIWGDLQSCGGAVRHRQNEEAIAMLLDIITIDRSWNDDAARIKLLEIFDALGAAAPEVMAGVASCHHCYLRKGKEASMKRSALEPDLGDLQDNTYLSVERALLRPVVACRSIFLSRVI